MPGRFYGNKGKRSRNAVFMGAEVNVLQEGWDQTDINDDVRHVFWHRGQFHALFSKADEHPGPIYIADSTDGLDWRNHRMYVDNENLSDANTVYPVNTEKNFPHGLGAYNALESADWRLLVKTLVRSNHRMDLGRTF